MVDRRSFLKSAATGAAFAAIAESVAFAEIGSPEPRPASVAIRTSSLGRRVPESYMGLSYELAQLTEPSFFSPQHADLISLFRTLSPSGLLRLGGNTSEFCWLQVDPSTPAPKLHAPPGDLAQNWMPHRLFAIQPAAIQALAGFLHQTGWRAIYGVNFGNSTPDRAAAEAAYVARTLGSKLAVFQIGNEPDFYRDANNGTRPPGWNFDDYVREWIAFADAITAAVPDARFGGADTGASSDWVVRFGQEVAPRLGRRLVALSGHYYAEGPPNDPSVTTVRLLTADPRVTSSTNAVVQVADAHNLTYHMTEGNSCYRGGKPGMSDAFAAALWAADYLLLLASLGCAGVNLHGGDSRFLSAGLGDHNPGLLVSGQQVNGAEKQARHNGFYTPISTEQGEAASARPVFYGMLLAQQFAGGTMVGVDLNIAGNVTAYASQNKGRFLIALINKESSIGFTISLTSDLPITKAEVWRLTAPGLNFTSGVALGEATISSAGNWTPQAQQLSVVNGATRVELPPATGALILLN
jgi:hypothetical protein